MPDLATPPRTATPSRLGAFRQILGASMTCMAMSGNGAPTATLPTPTPLLRLAPSRKSPEVQPESSEEAIGVPPRPSVAVVTAISPVSPAATSVTVSASSARSHRRDNSPEFDSSVPGDWSPQLHNRKNCFKSLISIDLRTPSRDSRTGQFPPVGSE